MDYEIRTLISHEELAAAIRATAEKINADAQMKLAMQDAKFNVFMQEMRDRDNQRAEEIRELRQDMKAMQASLDAKIDSMGKHVRNLAITSMAAVGGMFGAVGAMVATVIYTILKN